MRIGTCILAVGLATAIAVLATPSASRPDAETYAIDGVHSTVIFRIGHLGVSNFYGRFNEVKGSFTVAEGGTGAVDVTIPVASVDTANEKRDNHLKSPDFFSAEQFPEITFKSSELKHLGGSKYEAKGTLKLHGVEKQVTVPVERIGSREAMGGYRTGFEGMVTIQRSDFGMKNMLEAVGDEVRLILAVEGIRK
jgi:polyisoprenoid-binding protein YceI